MHTAPSAPVFLSIAGSDCSAGAGLQADLKAGFALGCYPLTAVTCVVNEVPGKVEGLVAMEADFVAAQVRLCLSSFPVRAVKCGMLYSPEIVRAVAEELAAHRLPLVIDPVMIATAGDVLMLEEAIAVYEECLYPLATLLTPNCDELQKLLGCAPLHHVSELETAAMELAARTRCAVLAKGGHLEGATCTDLLALPNSQRPQAFTHPRTPNVSTHGTGCTLSSAITAGLAQGLELTAAVEQGLHYTARAIAATLHLGALQALDHRAPQGLRPLVEGKQAPAWRLLG